MDSHLILSFSVKMINSQFRMWCGYESLYESECDFCISQFLENHLVDFFETRQAELFRIFDIYVSF